MNKITILTITTFLLITFVALSYTIYKQIEKSTGEKPKLFVESQKKPQEKNKKLKGPHFKLKLKQKKETNDSDKKNKGITETPSKIEDNNQNLSEKLTDSKKQKAKPPTSADVIAELDKILNRKRTKKEPQLKDSDFINLKDPLTFIILLITGIAIFVLIQYIVRNYQKNIKLEDIVEDIEHLEETSTVKELYVKAQQLAKDGNFNHAVIYLHIGTVIFLKDHFVIQKSKKYSNNEIKRQIKKKLPELLKPFGNIARLAEIAAFSKLYLVKDDFTQSIQLYEENFLNNRGRHL